MVEMRKVEKFSKRVSSIGCCVATCGVVACLITPVTMGPVAYCNHSQWCSNIFTLFCQHSYDTVQQGASGCVGVLIFLLFSVNIHMILYKLVAGCVVAKVVVTVPESKMIAYIHDSLLDVSVMPLSLPKKLLWLCADVSSVNHNQW
jgi:hypothetical protein